MSIELAKVAPQDMIRSMSHDSEYDDALGVPDSLDITIDENGEAIQVYKEGTECRDGKENPGVIPFTVVHDTSTKFKSQTRTVFIPGEEVFVRIIDNERSVTTHPLNPNLYTIEFRHGPFIWTIKKRYKHIQFLHNQLKIYRASLNIPFPTKGHRERRNSMKSLSRTAGEKMGRRNALPRFPNKPDILVPYEQLSQRRKELEEYLTNLLNIEIYKRHSETINFLDISHLSFVADLGMKGKEGTILKRTGSGAKTRCYFLGLFECGLCIKCSYLCTSLCGKWHKRHLVVKDTFVAYLNPRDGRIKSVILMDNGFGISLGVYTTGSRSGMQIANLSRHIVIKCWTKRKAKEWMEFIQEVSNNEGKDFIQTNPHNSFAPYRSSISATWFVDGADYMSAVADALENAKEEIFIADWWLSPEIHMKRPMSSGDYWRLDKILQRKAAQGVKIFVLIYKEIEVALGINSYYSKQKLVEQCPENIKVLRHPDHARAGVLLWAHHEKIVVIDQSLAFLGGIDLCYGRWDTNEHRLIDLESIHQSSIYIPSRDKQINTSSKKVLCSTERHVLLTLAIATNTIAMATTRSMPLLPMMDKKTQKDLMLSTLSADNSLFMLQEKGDGVKCNTPELQRKNLFDVAKTTVDKVKNTVRVKRQELINMVYTSHEADEIDEVDVENKLALPESEDTVDYGCSLQPTTKLWRGKDYTNFIVKDFNDLEKPYQDLVDRTTTPRMPWHDIGVLVQNAAARDVARHFIERWNATKLEKANQNKCYPYLLPKSYEDCKSYTPFIQVANKHNVKCQVLRSVSSWSIGFLDSETVERSIQEAYIQAISEAERYIYIENQFFITLASVEKGGVKNQIGETLLKRILRAHREGAVFRVFVVMPLLPGFEGEVGGPSGTALRAITHWNYNSISRGKDSILNQLLEAGIEDPSEYITFHGLRNHSMLNGTMVTELIYVHSKLMIVDDKTVICGSANINDRSMVATRDSEIAVIIHDQEFDDGRMNDIPFPCGKFASSLRKQLFREHLGLLHNKEDINIDDIVIKSFYKDIWCARSKRNTDIYEEVFHCIPTDKVINFAILKQYQEKVSLSISDPLLTQEMVENIKGHLVDLPLNFLCNEDLKPAAVTVEGIMPTALWT